MAANFTCDKFPRVKVLYDYDYTDEVDDTPVFMRVDEIFYLLNSDVDDWWQVCRPDSPEKQFYVPSTYVAVLGDVNDRISEENYLKTKTSLNESKGSKGNANMENTNGQVEAEKIYANVSPVVTDDSIQVQYHQHFQRPAHLSISTDDDYVNLEDFRKQAGIPSITPDSSPLDSADKV